jgi:hypothetical protein
MGKKRERGRGGCCVLLLDGSAGDRASSEIIRPTRRLKHMQEPRLDYLIK